MIEKTLSLQIEETKNALITIINNSGLHPYILDSIVGNIHNEIHGLYLTQLQEENRKYQEKAKNEELTVE